MTIARRLLDLTVEYAASTASRSQEWGALGAAGEAVGREPDEIAADYEATLRELLA